MPPPATRLHTQSSRPLTAVHSAVAMSSQAPPSVRDSTPPVPAIGAIAPVQSALLVRIDLSASDAIKVVTSVLDRGSHNWSEWSINFKDYLLSKHAWAYVLGLVTCPIEAVDPASVDLWDANNEAIIAIMHGRCSLEEKLFLEGQTNAFHTWKILRDRHEQISPVAQITLIQKLLQLRYRKTERFAKVSLEITEAVRRIYAMGMPTSDTFTLIMMMNALSDELPHVRDHIADAIVHSSTSDPYTPLMAHTRLDMEQQLADSKSTSSGTFVLAATSIPKPTTGHAALTCAVCGKSGHLKCCTNPKCPPECRVGHTWPECFSEGGGHAGQREAVLCEKAEKRHTTGKSGAVATGKPGNIRYDQSGRAYLVDPETNTAFALQDVPSAVCAQPTREFSGLASDILTPELVSSLPGYDTDEYDAMYLDTSALLTSLDWRCYSQPVNLAAVTYKALNQRARRPLTHL